MHISLEEDRRNWAVKELISQLTNFVSFAFSYTLIRQVVFILAIVSVSSISYSISCHHLFPNAETQIQRILTPSQKVQQLIHEARLQSNQRVSQEVAVRDLQELNEKLTRDSIAPEVSRYVYFDAKTLQFLEAFKSETINKINTLLHKVEREGGVPVEELFEVSLRSSLIFGVSTKARDSYMQIVNHRNEQVQSKEITDEGAKGFASELNLYRFQEEDIASVVDEFKALALKHPKIQLKVTFEDLTETDLYHLVKNRVFAVGITDQFISADLNVLSPYAFLIHDKGHIEGFFGYSNKPALFDRIGVRSQDIDIQNQLWSVLDKNLMEFEQQLAIDFIQGRIKHIESIDRFNFDLIHEVSNSIYFRLQNQSEEFLRDESILEVIRMKTGLKYSALKSVPDSGLVMSVKKDLEWLISLAQRTFVPPL